MKKNINLTSIVGTLIYLYALPSLAHICETDKCIDLSISDLESISQKSNSKGHEFFYLSENETRFFANFPKVSDCSVVGEYKSNTTSPAKKPSIRISTTPSCFTKLQNKKKELDTDRSWSSDKNTTALRLDLAANTKESDIVLIKKNSSYADFDIPERMWLPSESFSLGDILSDNDHFIYSESLLSAERKRIIEEENLNKLLAELDGHTKTIDACIRTKTTQSVAAAKTAIDMLKNDLDLIFSKMELTEDQENKITDLDNKILALENALKSAESALTEAEIEDQLSLVEQAIRKDRSSYSVLASMDNLDRLAIKHPERKSEIISLQKKALTQAVRVSTADDYIYVFDALDKYAYSPDFGERFTHSLMADTLTKATENSDVGSYDSEELLERSRALTLELNGDKNGLSDKFFEITVGLTDKVFLTDEITDSSRNAYVESLAELNKDTKSKYNTTIINKASHIYAHDLSSKGIDSMNKSLASLKKQKLFKDEDLFNIYRNTASYRMSVLNETGNFDVQAMGEVHNLMSGISNNVNLTDANRSIYIEDIASLSQIHVNTLVNTGDKNFNYYYASYKTQMQKEWARLSKERIKAYRPEVVRKGSKVTVNQADKSAQISQIESEMTQLQETVQNLDMSAKAYPIIVNQRHIEAQALALKAQQARLEELKNPTPQRGPGVAQAPGEGPGMQPGTHTENVQQPRTINNPNSIMNGFVIPEVQLPQN